VARAAPAVIKFIKSFFISKKSEQHWKRFADNGRQEKQSVKSKHQAQQKPIRSERNNSAAASDDFARQIS
jgi:hypothetical protein